MTPHLTDDQLRALEDRVRAPTHVVDSRTNVRYVLLRAELYERLRAVFEEEFNPREAYPFVDRVMAEHDSNDPALAAFQDAPMERAD
jgi:hypothetical protein